MPATSNRGQRLLPQRTRAAYFKTGGGDIIHIIYIYIYHCICKSCVM